MAKIKNYTKDLAVMIGVFLLFLPIYLYRNSDYPFQITTDEIISMNIERNLLNDRNFNIFTLTERYHYHFPNFTFGILGKIANLMGQVELATMRQIQAAAGLAIITLGYLLFRLVTNSRWWAAVGALILGFNHPLIIISRFAMWDNTALLTTLLSLVALVFGIKKNSNTAIFFGGCLLGLSFYTHFTGKIMIVVWFGFLIISYWLKKIDKDLFFKRFGLSLAGTMIVALPMIVNIIKHYPESVSYQKGQILLFSGARQDERQRTKTASNLSLVAANAIRGLTAFNNKVTDQSWIYYNPGYGFLDVASGVLLWAGIIITVRKRKEEMDYLFLTGFFVLYFSFSFLITRPPSYPRLLITLPFIAFFNWQAMQYFYNRLKVKFLISCSIMFIAILNLAAALNFINLERNSDPLSEVYRYLKSASVKNIYIISPKNNPLFNKITSERLSQWLHDELGAVMVENTSQLDSSEEKTLVLDKTEFKQIRALSKNLRIKTITSSGEVIVVDFSKP